MEELLALQQEHGLEPEAGGPLPLRPDLVGGWGGDARSCRSASRAGNPPGDRVNFLGFRLLRIE